MSKSAEAMEIISFAVNVRGILNIEMSLSLFSKIVNGLKPTIFESNAGSISKGVIIGRKIKRSNENEIVATIAFSWELNIYPIAIPNNVKRVINNIDEYAKGRMLF